MSHLLLLSTPLRTVAIYNSQISVVYNIATVLYPFDILDMLRRFMYSKGIYHISEGVTTRYSIADWIEPCTYRDILTSLYQHITEYVLCRVHQN